MDCCYWLDFKLIFHQVDILSTCILTWAHRQQSYQGLLTHGKMRKIKRERKNWIIDMHGTPVACSDPGLASSSYSFNRSELALKGPSVDSSKNRRVEEEEFGVQGNALAPLSRNSVAKKEHVMHTLETKRRMRWKLNSESEKTMREQRNSYVLSKWCVCASSIKQKANVANKGERQKTFNPITRWSNELYCQQQQQLNSIQQQQLSPANDFIYSFCSVALFWTFFSPLLHLHYCIAPSPYHI